MEYQKNFDEFQKIFVHQIKNYLFIFKYYGIISCGRKKGGKYYGV